MVHVALLAVILLAAGPGDKPRIITVSGCLVGSSLKVTDTNTSGTYIERFRLRGSKELLKALTKDHKGHEVEVTGALMDPKGVTGQGKTVQVGKKTTIYTNARDRGETTPATDPSIEVQSFRDVRPTCR